MDDGANGFKIGPISPGKLFDVLQAVFFISGGDRGENGGFHHSFLEVKKALIVGVFYSFFLLQNPVNCNFRLGLVTIDHLKRFLFSVLTLPALARSAAKSRMRVMPGLEGGAK